MSLSRHVTPPPLLIVCRFQVVFWDRIDPFSNVSQDSLTKPSYVLFSIASRQQIHDKSLQTTLNVKRTLWVFSLGQTKGHRVRRRHCETLIEQLSFIFLALCKLTNVRLFLTIDRKRCNLVAVCHSVVKESFDGCGIWFRMDPKLKWSSNGSFITTRQLISE